MPTFPGTPKTPRDPDVIRAKLAQLEADHMAKLSALTRKIATAQNADVPWFDPASGGIRSRVLCLVESPGPDAAHSAGLKLSPAQVWHPAAGSRRTLDAI